MIRATQSVLGDRFLTFRRPEFHPVYDTHCFLLLCCIWLICIIYLVLVIAKCFRVPVYSLLLSNILVTTSSVCKLSTRWMICTHGSLLGSLPALSDSISTHRMIADSTKWHHASSYWPIAIRTLPGVALVFSGIAVSVSP